MIRRLFSVDRDDLMPSRRRPEPEPTLSIFPDRIHIGDRFIEADIGDEEREWEVISRPVTFKKGHEVRARVQRPGDPGTAREKYWAAHTKITVRRMTAAVSRPTAEIDDDVADVDALRRRAPPAARRGPGPPGAEARPRATQRLPGARTGGDAEEDPEDDRNVVRRRAD